jgi:putative toxin-antitoxin system antitoxin component (TIGR02293 family)
VSTESSPRTPASDVPIPASSEADDQAQAAVIRRTVQVIGNEPEAMRWLGTPVRALNYSTPISLLHDPKGREDVLTALGRLEHGVL